MTTTQDQNTPTNTLEEKVRDIIFEYGSTNKSVNLGEAKSLIMELISEAVNKAVLTELKLHATEWVEINEDGTINPSVVHDRIIDLETPKQVEETE